MNATKSILIVLGLALLTVAGYFGMQSIEKSNAAGANASAATTTALESDEQKLGYAFGSQIGKSIAQDGLIDHIDLDSFLNAIRDLASGKESLMSPEEMLQAQQNFQNKRAQEYQALAAQNQVTGESFMEGRKDDQGVMTTESGLQYEQLREGKGVKPTVQDTVKVHYSGALSDGTIFDSSYDRNEPTSFPVTGVIPGFSEGLQLMSEGSKYRFVIPASQAYGPQGPPSIGPNQVLVFEVELLEILNKDTSK